MFQSPFQCLYHRRSVDGYTRKYVYLNCRVKLAAARQSAARGPWKWPSISRSNCRMLGRGRSHAPSARQTGCLRGERARVHMRVDPNNRLVADRCSLPGTPPRSTDLCRPASRSGSFHLCCNSYPFSRRVAFSPDYLSLSSKRRSQVQLYAQFISCTQS